MKIMKLFAFVNSSKSSYSEEYAYTLRFVAANVFNT